MGLVTAAEGAMAQFGIPEVWARVFAVFVLTNAKGEIVRRGPFVDSMIGVKGG